MELEKARNEVLRKIGRNIFLFQQVEHMLKFLVANGTYSGYVSEIKAIKEQRAASVNRQTMGQLVGQLIENTHSEYKENPEHQFTKKDAYLTVSFKVESDAVYYETKKEALSLIVSNRNELIHHLLPRFNPDSIESCLELDQFLDKQREKLIPEIDFLRNMIDNLRECKKQFAEFLMSDEGEKWFKLSWLRGSRLVLLLGEIAAQAARPDGWTQLDTAVQLIRQHAPEEMAAFKNRYGHKTLKSLILATELFDINEEPTKKGGIRLIYRLKADGEMQNT